MNQRKVSLTRPPNEAAWRGRLVRLIYNEAKLSPWGGNVSLGLLSTDVKDILNKPKNRSVGKYKFVSVLGYIPVIRQPSSPTITPSMPLTLTVTEIINSCQTTGSLYYWVVGLLSWPAILVRYKRDFFPVVYSNWYGNSLIKKCGTVPYFKE